MIWGHGKMFRYEADADDSGAVETPSTGTDPVKTEPAAKVFTQAEVDALIKDRLKRAQDKARADADAEAAKKNGEWQTLAEQREQELKNLQAQLRETQIRAVAAKLGFQDLDYAVYLASRADEGADLEQYLKERAPKAEAPAKPPTLPNNATNPAEPLRFTAEQIRNMTPAEINKNWDAISAALAAGRTK